MPAYGSRRVQAVVMAGSLSKVGKPSIEDDDDFLDVPNASDVDDEGLGVADAEELLFNELDEGPEDVGLDTESGASSEGLATLDTDDDEDETALDDEAPLEIEPEIDAEGEEGGWTRENEGSTEPWDGELEDDDLEGDVDADAGEEGVDDPLLDGLPEDEPPRREDEDEDEDEDEWLDDLPPDLQQDA